jgi:alkylation response protein AidB-like acyl-CoA dehydrogenase
MGYSRELPIERYYRDSRINRIFEGTNEIQKGIIARDVLKRMVHFNLLSGVKIYETFYIY